MPAGRPPKPSALKRAEGNPGKRRLNDSEPRFSSDLKCPAWLTAEAKREWRRVTAELEALDMLQSVDQAALASYCMAWARWQAAEKIVSDEGQTVKEPVVNKAGVVVGYKTKRHPATTVAKDERAAMLRSAALFGFDPSSRSRLHTGKGAAPEDPFEAFMRGLTQDTDDDPGEEVDQVGAVPAE